jgi:phage shock protein PspC (stress-responsive transcriptional regulator)
VSGVDAIDVSVAGTCGACAVALGVDPVLAPVVAALLAAALRTATLWIARSRTQGPKKDGEHGK